jgi:DNA-binding XRE family transcriptional regulator
MATEKVQFITTPGGEELAVLSRADYERFAALAEETEEDIGTARVVDRALSQLERGEEIVLPAEVSDRIANGESPLRVVREWLDISQAELAVHAGFNSQSYISDLERGVRKGPVELWRKLAGYLKVPVDLIMP